MNVKDAVSSRNEDLAPSQGERYTLSAESELRIEVPFNQSATIKLITGSSEIFGAEMAAGKEYELTGTNIAIFTWHGCTIDVDDRGSPLEIVYISDETDANVAYVNTHAQLETLRDEALAAATSSSAEEGAGKLQGGPRVMLVGPTDCGKSSLARTLAAYAVKVGRCPLLVDIDPSQNMLSVPGTIAAAPMKPKSVDISTHSSLGFSIAGGTSPLVLWYGSTDITSNPALYKAQLDKLGRDVDARMDGDVDTKADGFFVNTSGLIEGVGYKCLLHAIDALRINIVLVVGHDRLFSMLTTHFKKRIETSSSNDSVPPDSVNASKESIPKVIKLPRSGGVVSRHTTYRRSCRAHSIKQYFNGQMTDLAAANPVHQYTPFLLEIPFSSLAIKRLSGLSLTSSMLPVAAKQSTDPVQLQSVEIGPALKHALLAVCHPQAMKSFEQSGQTNDLYLSGVAGFVAVEKVDMGREIISLLCPCAGNLPTNTLLQGEVTWME